MMQCYIKTHISLSLGVIIKYVLESHVFECSVKINANKLTSKICGKLTSDLTRLVVYECNHYKYFFSTGVTISYNGIPRIMVALNIFVSAPPEYGSQT